MKIIIKQTGLRRIQSKRMLQHGMATGAKAALRGIGGPEEIMAYQVCGPKPQLRARKRIEKFSQIIWAALISDTAFSISNIRTGPWGITS